MTRRLLLALFAVAALVLAACGDSDDDDAAGAAEGAAGSLSGTLRIGAIPDQDPDVLARTYDLLTGYLEGQLPGVTVEYVPAVDYPATVSAFTIGDLDAAWFGGLTGVQARLEVEGARAVVQRDIDAEFTSVFIARADSGLGAVADVEGLSVLAGRRLAFGSESSTSGRLMPQHFLSQAGIDPESDLDGPPGFSGSHDATIEVVEAGTYEVGALNSQVWDSRVEAGEVDTDEVIEIFRTPTYFDYHWIVQPDLDERLGDGATRALIDALLALDASDPDQAAVLEAFGAAGFIETENANYAAIEEVGRAIGLIR